MGALQMLFRELDRNDLPVSPSVLIESFGWRHNEVQQQNDFFDFWKFFGNRISREASLNAIHQEIFEGAVSYNSSPEVDISRYTKSFIGTLYKFFVPHIHVLINS